MSFLVRGVAAGIGVASESYQTHKEKKAAKKAEVNTGETESETSSPVIERERQPSEPETPDSAAQTHELDLDEAQHEVAKPTLDPNKIGFADVSKLAAHFAAAHLPPQLPPGERFSPLDCAVVLPQRRPNSRARGFIHAYAPILESRGIDQATFLSFIEMFNYASQASPFLNAINLAQLACQPLSPIIGVGAGIAISIAIELAVETTVEITSRHRTNEFLDRMNQYFFRPRGLYCMVMTWRPQSTNFTTSTNLGDHAQEQAQRTEGGSRSFFNRFAPSAGTSYGNLHFPDCATLVFPGLDALSQADRQELQDKKKKGKFGRFADSIDDYMDRRARAKYIMWNPNSELAHLGPRPQFKSRFADPSHPASRGGLVGLLTGGAVTIGDSWDIRGAGLVNGTLFEKKDRSVLEKLDKNAGKYSGQYHGVYQEAADQEDALTQSQPSTTSPGGVRPSNIIKMMLGRETLYLAIVDLPSREQLKEAAEYLAQADPTHAAQYHNIDVDAATSRTAAPFSPEYAAAHRPANRASQALFAREFEQAYGVSPPEEAGQAQSRHSPEGPPPGAEEAGSPRYEEVARPSVGSSAGAERP